MKWSWLAVSASAVAGVLLTAPNAHGADTGRPVLVEFRAVSLPFPAALTVASALSRAEATEADFRALDEMVVKGSAELVSHSVIWSTGTADTSSSGGEDFRYPSEFDPPSEPMIFGTGTAVAFHPPYVLRPLWGEMVPTCFETRELGTQVHAETQVNPESSEIRLTFNGSITRFVKLETYPGATSPLGTTGEAVQPIFDTQKVTTTLNISSGRSAICASFFLEIPSPRLLLFVLRATALPILR